MPDRYTTEEAGVTLGVTPARVNQLKDDLQIEPEKIGRANFFSLSQIKQMQKWLNKNGYKKGGKK
jgi:hypothetical protein